jgi:hypothetical protein
MSEYSRFSAWNRSCMDRPGYGITPGDTMHLGLRDYNQPYPCPNGLPVQTGGPQESEAWQRRVEKARRFIESYESEHTVRNLVATLQPSVVKAFLRALSNGES